MIIQLKNKVSFLIAILLVFAPRYGIKKAIEFKMPYFKIEIIPNKCEKFLL